MMAEQLVPSLQKVFGERSGSTGFYPDRVMLGLPGFIEQTRRINLRGGLSGSEVLQAMKTCLPSAGNTRWLVVFDNHDDITSVKLADFLPNGDFGSIIITTRRPEVKHFGVGIRVARVEKNTGISITLGRVSKDPHAADDSSIFLDLARVEVAL